MRCCIGLLILALAACAPAPVKPPQVVQVTVTKYVPVPADLTAPCPIAKPAANTVQEAVRVARERRASIEKCNGQLEAIQALGNQK
ncbi:Rz1-like lysis system protein LysC [Dokdonella soli]|uniref:Uncharacterized protein n=1 Tax=Dokdonella soli TaxID=529810 RepID=A0ABN1IUC4_9GAMM